jgi:hypothetical protein
VGYRTASGEILDTITATAAHRSLPLASFAKAQAQQQEQQIKALPAQAAMVKTQAVSHKAQNGESIQGMGGGLPSAGGQPSQPGLAGPGTGQPNPDWNAGDPVMNTQFRSLIAALFATVGGISVASAGTSLPPPSGYTSSQLIFEDQFTSATLDTTKWNPWLGDDLYGRWGNQGKLPSPYSGTNCDSTCSDANQVMFYDPFPYGYGTNITGNHLVGGVGYLGVDC